MRSAALETEHGNAVSKLWVIFSGRFALQLAQTLACCSVEVVVELSLLAFLACRCLALIIVAEPYHYLLLGMQVARYYVHVEFQSGRRDDDCQLSIVEWHELEKG
jgi:hypothetical protein